MIALWWTLAALAAAPTCDPDLDPLDETLSVAWVSPLGEKVGRRGWMRVVPTSVLREEAQEGASLARTLQMLGIRRRDSEPRRRYKVTIFDVRSADLCRPVQDQGQIVAGVVACPDGRSRANRTQDGCGYTLDRKTRQRGLPAFWIRWEDAARAGFCVLPAERFLSGD